MGYAIAFELFKKPKDIKSILLPVEFVPESMLINNVLNLLIKTCFTSGFTIKVPGQSAVVVSGNKMNDAARKAIAKAKRGDVFG